MLGPSGAERESGGETVKGRGSAAFQRSPLLLLLLFCLTVSPPAPLPQSATRAGGFQEREGGGFRSPRRGLSSPGAPASRQKVDAGGRGKGGSGGALGREGSAGSAHARRSKTARQSMAPTVRSSWQDTASSAPRAGRMQPLPSPRSNRCAELGHEGEAAASARGQHDSNPVPQQIVPVPQQRREPGCRVSETRLSRVQRDALLALAA